MVDHINKDQLIPYGHIRKTHGHKGAMVLTLESDVLLDIDPEFIFIEIDGIPVPFRIEEFSGTKDHLITKVGRISSSEEADKYRDAQVYISKSTYDEQINIEDMEHLSLYHLVGYKIYHSSGSEIGTLSAIDENTANILLIVENSDRDIYIPFVEEWITRLDHKNRALEINCPTELLQLNEK
ncbi:ribosome maturation factor RimM [Porphyromonas sp.]|uniref:ribosome maturation factor RimM n=1 Tax=Porphyromonas sp. TaxID=1924944 RepID=UPI0026DBE9C0|nr:ribosome maturation factor RimM [Porphyromonas sp.]MDO4695144.1 ribosome maturation factor RimM [Porphyromonas sp.]MDO4770212.1 ribosome maturation factor RimM [Porphyromonas sp.]